MQVETRMRGNNYHAIKVCASIDAGIRFIEKRFKGSQFTWNKEGDSAHGFYTAENQRYYVSIKRTEVLQ